MKADILEIEPKLISGKEYFTVYLSTTISKEKYIDLLNTQKQQRINIEVKK